VSAHKRIEYIQSVAHQHGWNCDFYRWPSTDVRDPRNTAKTRARPNALVAWRPGQVVHIAWIWEVEAMSAAEILALLARKDSVSLPKTCIEASVS